MLKNRAVFLDRDGVINEVVFHCGGKPSSPWKFDEFRLIPGIKKPLDELHSAGFMLFIISNQPDISRGYLEPGTTEKINETICRQFPIKEIRVCPHDDSHNCECRKPKPGMLLELSRNWGIDLKRSFLIGDNWKDIEAGKAAGCTTILIDTEYNRTVGADHHAHDLGDAARIIAHHSNAVKKEGKASPN